MGASTSQPEPINDRNVSMRYMYVCNIPSTGYVMLHFTLGRTQTILHTHALVDNITVPYRRYLRYHGTYGRYLRYLR